MLSPVQIDNTDAEGRLTLADALWYAQTKCQAEAMVNIATLTGACMIALGKQVQGPRRNRWSCSCRRLTSGASVYCH